MSWEAWGSGPEPFDIDKLYERGWESNSTCDKWWKAGEPETTYTLDQAMAAYEDQISSED